MKTSFSNRNRLTAGILLIILVPLCLGSTAPPPARTDGGGRQAGQEKKEHFTDEDLKVEKIPGKWRLAGLTDRTQWQDYSVPVIISAFKTVYGQGKYLGRIKIPEMRIENRSQKVLHSLQLRWTVSKYDEPDTILLEGVMPFMDVHIEPFSPPLQVNITPVYFNKIVRPLLKDGELNFHILLTLGVQEARFADGTSWQRTRKVALLKTSFARPSLNSSAPFFDISL